VSVSVVTDASVVTTKHFDISVAESVSFITANHGSFNDKLMDY